MDPKTERMKELVSMLNDAGKAYYQESREIMSNYEYDKLYDELLFLEKETRTVLSNSPTAHVGYEIVSELPKEKHSAPMLSLDKTKDTAALKDWLGDKTGLLSWKLDGLTIVLTYESGGLLKAVTRGNGEVGEVITNNARVFQNIPLKIPFRGRLILRGEAVIRYSDFERINRDIGDAQARYKNPRNLCSGSVRQLNNEITAKRNVRFYAFTLVSAVTDGKEEDFQGSRLRQMEWLSEQGFDTVPCRITGAESLEADVAWFAERIEENDIPSDGLVLIFDDLEYGRSLGTTAKFPRDSIAFKWADEARETTLRDIEWSASRTGLINPIAVFDPVELEGTTVSRASVHNISIMEGLSLGIGDTVRVYKANMIIPQIAENLTGSGTCAIPEECPVCGGRTVIRQENDVRVLYCTNEECQAKKIKAFTHFVGRDAMNIEGLSEATVEKLVDRGYIHSLSDLFHVDRYQKEITEMEGFGEKSLENLLSSIEKSRSTTLPRLIYSLGIPGVGLSNARLICRAAGMDPSRLLSATREELDAIDGIGDVIADSFVSYFEKEENREQLESLLNEVSLTVQEQPGTEQTLSGMTFVITGALTHFPNRNALKERIERLGGRVSGSVSAKTTCLINNDSSSSSAKNRKARELSVPILTEEEFMEKMELN